MKRILLSLLAFLATCAPVGAWTIEDRGSLTRDDLARLMPGKLFTLESVAMADADGTLFFLARDKKTRTLQWYVIDPFAKRVLSKGECPFKVFSTAALSPDHERAVVYAKYPSSAWSLTVANGEWTRGLQNSRGAGLAIVSFSPLAFVADRRAMTVLDDRDAGGVVLESVLVSLAVPGLAVERVATLRQLCAAGIKALGVSTRGWDYDADYLRYGEDGSVAYVLKSKSKKTGKTKRWMDALLRFEAGGKTSVLARGAQGERLFPLDYQSQGTQLLYSSATGKATRALLGNKVIFTGKAIAGAIMENDLLGIAALEGASVSIYLGKAEAPLRKAYNTPVAYAVGFTSGGQRVLLVNDREVRCLAIRP